MNPLHETKHVFLNAEWHWEVKCQDCGEWVKISNEQHEKFVKREYVVMHLAGVGGSIRHWIDATLKGGE